MRYYLGIKITLRYYHDISFFVFQDNTMYIYDNANIDNRIHLRLIDYNGRLRNV